MVESRKLILGTLLAALAAGTWWLTHRAATPSAAPSAQPRHEPDYTIDGFVGNSMGPKGDRTYRLTARSVTHYPDDDTTHLVDPVLVQYLPGGVTFTARGDVGVMPGDGSSIELTGNVHVTRTAKPGAAGGETTAERLRLELDR